MLLQYSIIFIILFAASLLYFKIADKYRIVDKPNQRSSHTKATIRGGGIVFWLAGVFYFIMHFPESAFFLIGLSLICAVSFWDDILSLPNRVRLLGQFVSISLIFYSIGIFSAIPWWLTLFCYVFFIGVMNAYNFMDGINGITGLYSLAILLCLQYVNQYLIEFTSPDFINYAILACIVFLVFNFRKSAICFAGDVGSIGISFWIVTLLLQLMLATHSLVWILFLAIYGVDSILTILHRIYLKQNIFKAHRLHFYQILANELKVSQKIVSAVYAIVQLFVCIFVIYNFKVGIVNNFLLFFIVLQPLAVCYLYKFRLMRHAQDHFK